MTDQNPPTSDENIPIINPDFVVRGQYDIPATAIDDNPSLCVGINYDWIPHIVGALDVLDQPDAWNGTETEIENARAEIRKLIANFSVVCGDDIMPAIGSVIQYAGKLASLPSHFLPCNGAQYLRVDYPLLYDALETVYQIDADNFIVPDTRSRAILGSGQSVGNSNRIIGAVGGAENVQLTTGQMPAHNHLKSSLGNGTTWEMIDRPSPDPLIPDYYPDNRYPVASASGLAIVKDFATGGAGGNQAHENMPPFLVLNHYIVARYP